MRRRAVNEVSPYEFGECPVKTIALLIGIVLIGLGVACFVPGLAADGVLFGKFPVSTPLAIAFIVTGAVGVMIGLTRRSAVLTTAATSENDMRNRP